MSEPLILTWAGYGAILHPLNIAGHRDPMFVMHPCETTGKRFFCATHELHVANLGNLEMHLDMGGAHHVAVWCGKHGVYEAPDATELAEFRRLAQPSLTLSPKG